MAGQNSYVSDFRCKRIILLITNFAWWLLYILSYSFFMDVAILGFKVEVAKLQFILSWCFIHCYSLSGLGSSDEPSNLNLFECSDFVLFFKEGFPYLGGGRFRLPADLRTCERLISLRQLTAVWRDEAEPCRFFIVKNENYSR